MPSISKLFLFFSLALCASASQTGNAWNELSSPGGTFSVGSGDTFTTFSINSFDVFLSFDGQVIEIDGIGMGTLPKASINSPELAGFLELDLGGQQVLDAVYVMADDFCQQCIDGNLQYGIQMTGINLPDGHRQVQFWYPPVTAQSGTQQPLTAMIYPVDSVPEPATLGIVGAALIALATGRLRTSRGAGSRGALTKAGRVERIPDKHHHPVEIRIRDVGGLAEVVMMPEADLTPTPRCDILKAQDG